MKIERAQKVFGDLMAEVDEFLKSGPYAIDQSEDNGDLVQRARILREPPAHWGAMSGDVIHNLRASLDNLWFYLMYPNGGGDDDRKTDFPIYDTRARFVAKHERDRRFAGRRKQALDILKEVQPYKGGNDTLYLLHQLDIIDKHKTLIPAYSAVTATFIDFSKMVEPPAGWPPIPSMELGLNWANPACPVRTGTELWRVTADQRTRPHEANPKFQFTIALGDAPLVKGKPLIGTLNTMAFATMEAIRKFEPLIPG